MITEIKGTCQWEGCDQPATHIACGRNCGWPEFRVQHPEPGCFCKAHAWEVAEEGSPEYRVFCPNCDCLLGTG